MEREEGKVIVSKNSKRKFQEICRGDDDGEEELELEASINGSLDDLNQDLLERVLSRLPTSSFLRLSSVCKRWKSTAESTTFRRACSEIPSRDPWFYMAGDRISGESPVVFDSSEMNWKVLNPPLFHNFVPVASSGGLLCFYSETDGFIVSNPITGTFRKIPPVNSYSSAPLRAITIISAPNSYKLITISGEFPVLCFRVFDSRQGKWTDNTFLTSKSEKTSEDSDSENLYFLSKCGDLVSPELIRSPCKKHCSIFSDETVFFLSSSGAIMAINLARKYVSELPRIIPIHQDHSIDLVECRGEVLAVVLSEFLETESLRVWRFDDEKTGEWEQVAAMPPAMSHEFYGKNVDVNCAGAGGRILVCGSCEEFCRYFMCDLEKNEWIELENKNLSEFDCAFSFEPRIEALT